MTIDTTDFWPLDERFGQDFWPALDSMRTACPVARSDSHDGFWVLTGHDEIREVLRDPVTFSSEVCVTAVPLDTDVRPIPGQCDPPLHTTVRRALAPYFTPAVIAVHEPAMRVIARELIAGWDPAGVDFVRDFADRFPPRIFFECILGLDEESLAEVLPWTELIATDPSRAATALEAIQEWGLRLYRSRARTTREPGSRGIYLDGVLDVRIDGRPLDDVQLKGTILATVFAGLETTSSALANAVHHIASDPVVATTVRAAAGDDRRLAEIVEEFLRFEAPNTAIARTTTRDVEIGGQVIRAGERVVMYLASANRDPAAFANSGLDLDRRLDENRHLSFGLGIHRCLGSNLAKLQLRVALDELVQALDEIGPATSAVRYRNGITRAPDALPITFRRSGGR